MSIDYPRGWELARSVPIVEHDARCSYRQTSGGLICDCNVIYEHPEFKADVLYGAGGEVIRERSQEYDPATPGAHVLTRRKR